MPFSLSLSLGILTVEAVLALNNKDAERPPLTFVFSAVSEPGALLQPPPLALAAAAFLMVLSLTEIFAFATSLSFIAGKNSLSLCARCPPPERS
jgi:hypothetical protein